MALEPWRRPALNTGLCHFSHLQESMMPFVPNPTFSPAWHLCSARLRPALAALGIAAACCSAGARAQDAQTPPGAQSAASAALQQAPAAAAAHPASSATPAAGANAAPAPPRYSASALKQAFSFMDSNHDGQVSREEAAGFRGVARHFDQADTDHDGMLSAQEFEAAMNYVKPR